MIWFVCYLVILSVEDFRTRKVGLGWLIAGSVIAGAFLCLRLWNGEVSVSHLLLGFLPGILMLTVSVLGKQVGSADGWVLLLAGCVMEWGVLWLLFMLSLLFAALVAGGKLVLRKGRRKDKLPYLPFLAVAVTLSML